MSAEEKYRDAQLGIDLAEKIHRINVAKAERVRYTLPWTDPHFVNILRRVYRDYIKRRAH